MSVRGISTVVLPAVKNVRLKRYACAAIAKARVLIASRRPRTRNAPTPTTTATRLAKEAPSNKAQPNEIPPIPPSRMRVECQPMLNWSPRISAAAVSAPMPANAICPSDSCPAQPVSTTTETAHSAKAMIVAQVWWRSDLSLSIGRTMAAISVRSARTCGIRLTHQMLRNRSGTAAMRGANWKLSPVVSESRRLTRATRTSTMMKRTNCTSPVSDV